MGRRYNRSAASSAAAPLEEDMQTRRQFQSHNYFHRVTLNTHEAIHRQRNNMAAKIEKVDMSLDDIIKQNKKNTRGGRGGRGRRGRGGGGPVRGGRGRINKNRSTPYSRVSVKTFFRTRHNFEPFSIMVYFGATFANLTSLSSLNSYQTDGSMTFLTAIVVSEEDGIVVLVAASPLAVNFTFPTWILVFLIQIFR